MRMVDLIAKKRDGHVFTKEEIHWIVNEYTEGKIPDYQVSALLMAIYFQGMDFDETYYLTDAMAHSGDIVDLSGISGVKVDKHSTGGVGDKVTLVLAPLAASLGLKVAKMSGRGLGHTGGTIDKLEAIPGFNTEIKEADFIRQVDSIGAAVVGQTGNLTPADKKLYALRDVTATVESIPLIAASIMSKKIAAGSDIICLDVKVGSGAFMKTLERARELSKTMIEIGKRAGRHVIVFLTDMDQPLGYNIGNALEVSEAIDTLKGKGPEDLSEVTATIVGYMLFYSEKVSTIEEGITKATEALKTGEAITTLKDMLEAQGGDSRIIEDSNVMPTAQYVYEVCAKADGVVASIDAFKLGHLGMELGAGRATKEDTIDYGVGLATYVKVGDRIKQGDIIGRIYANNENEEKYAALFLDAFTVDQNEHDSIPLIFEIITA
ncbi:MAG: pyrimidine-nucleoside phosphorylase [Culicoidibacterales bacterium]